MTNSKPDPEFFGKGMAGMVFAVYEPDFLRGLRHGYVRFKVQGLRLREQGMSSSLL